MHRILKPVTLFVLTTCVLQLSRPASGEENPSLTVVVYNDAQVPSDILAGAEQRAAIVFSHSGLDLNWVNRAHRDGDHDSWSSTETSEPGHLVLRIIAQVAPSISDAAFGIAFLGPDGTGQYCQVFWKRVKELQTNDNVKVSGILGSVMAHEIGHLLLGSHAHAISGIMRGHWEKWELHQIAMGTLLFLPEQEHRMRSRVAALAALLVSTREEQAQ